MDVAWKKVKLVGWTDNPIRDFERWDAEQEEKLEKMPVCDECGEHIQDDYLYDIGGEILCRTCMENKYERSVDDYVG